MGIRPNFAEDVYGEKDKKPEEEHPEYSESSLAHRRSANVLKLKQLKDAQPMVHPEYTSFRDIQRHESTENIDRDLDFEYTDSDTLSHELAELYSYSEMDEFGTNVHCWRSYADSQNIESPFYFSSLPDARKTSIVQDLISKTESAEPDVRLSTARIILYLLQGAVLDFVDEEEQSTDDALMKAPEDRGTGGYEEECVLAGARNAYLFYKNGAYQALCTLLMAEMNEPFDCGQGCDGRTSKSSSRAESRHASNADLSDADRSRIRRSPTLVDNAMLRVILSCIYHMLESIRSEETSQCLQSENQSVSKLRHDFLEELDEPIEHGNETLLMVLLDMIHPFYIGLSPHYPIKKIVLLIWKILLSTLGGWDVLEAKKREKRVAAGLPTMENTLKVASSLPAFIAQDGDGARLLARRAGSIARAGMMARQLAYNDDSLKEDEGSPTSSSKDDSSEDGSSSSSRSSEEGTLRQRSTEHGTPRQGSGDRTPRVGSPVHIPPKKILPWKSKSSYSDIEEFIQNGRRKFFKYELPPGDDSSLFGLPPSYNGAIDILRKNIYTSLTELQIKKDEDLNRYLFSMKENVEESKAETLYRKMLPNMAQYICELVKVLVSAVPSNKARNEGLNLLVDVLTPEMEASDILSNSISLDNSTSSPLEDGFRLAIDINRHKEIIVKALSSIFLLLVKHFKLNHIYQFEYICQQIVYVNGIPLILKYLDQNTTKHIQARHEIFAYNYPQCLLHFVRNGEEFPILNQDNIEEIRAGPYFMWRNLFYSINMIRLLNKLVKGKHARIMMLMVFKSAPCLKRLLKVRSPLFQVYVLKAIKMQSRYLGRQWRKSNMDIISAIYSRVRHRMTDDWAFASDMRRTYDYQNEENVVKACIERFHSRRYSKYYPQFAIEVDDAPMPGDDYLNRVDMREFEPVDNCAHSVLGSQPHLGNRFKKNYEKWMEKEVLRANIDWDKLLMVTKGVGADLPP